MSLASAEAPARTVVHPVDEVLPPVRLVTLGLQHFFIMYAGAVAVPIIVGGALKLSRDDIAMLINADLLICGIVTIVQAVGLTKWLGCRLPLASGATFTTLTPMIVIGSQFATAGKPGSGLPVVYGGMIVAGIIGIAIAGLFARLIRFFPPLVSGVVISVIGLSLIGVNGPLIDGTEMKDRLPAGLAPGDFALIALAGLVVLLIVVFTRFFKGFLGQIAVLLSMVIATIVSVPMGLVDFSGVSSASWIGISTPMHFGTPQFNLSAIISMTIVLLVTYTESTADMMAVADICDVELTPTRLSAGLRMDAVSSVLAGFMNSFPDTAFAENVGLVSLTGVRSRWVVAVCGGFLFVMGLIPKFGQIVAAIPSPVVGGAALVMFAMVTSIGIQTLKKVRFDGKYAHNLLIVAVALSVGLLPAFQPKIYDKFPDFFKIIFGSSITSAVIIVFVLNLVFNHFRTVSDDDVEELATAS